jgi:hypothetical protein
MKIISVCLLIGLLFTGCEILETETPSSVREFEISINNLPPVADSLQYMAWIADVGGNSFYLLEKIEPVNGSFSKIYTEVAPKTFVSMEYIMVTIERRNTHDTLLTKPSDVPILVGYVTGNNAVLKFSEDIGLPNFSGVTGSYVLATPTDPAAPLTTTGIWFIQFNDSTGKEEKGLNLPELTNGWFYKGWVEVNGKLISTGVFKNPGAPDSNYFIGSGAGYKFPGEDFLNNPPEGFTFPMDLKGLRVYITLQPKFDLASPFGFKLFEAVVPSDAVPGSVNEFQTINLSVPSGSAKLKWQI